MASHLATDGEMGVGDNTNTGVVQSKLNNYFHHPKFVVFRNLFNLPIGAYLFAIKKPGYFIGYSHGSPLLYIFTLNVSHSVTQTFET
jgi:hypothetical protein